MKAKQYFSHNKIFFLIVLFSILLGMGIATISFYTGFQKGRGFLAFAEESKIKDNPAVVKASEIQSAFELVAKVATPAVVNISTEIVIKQSFNMGDDPFFKFFGKDWFDYFFGGPQGPQERKFIQRALGTGVIITKDGYILTNFHVVKNATKIKVKLKNGKTYKAKVIGVDPKSDLALIKINAKKDLKYAVLGNSDNIRVGDWAIAIGNPFGLNHTLTVGIISAKGRSGIMNDASKYENFIQTDASINPGNSGGPLLNIKGEVIGINTAIATPSGGNVGIGFAIPINMAKKIVKQLRAKGKVERGWLGINIQELTEDLAKFFKVKPNSGVLVSDVVKNSPAKKAGFKSGDIITQFDGKKVTDVNTLRNIVAETPPYTKVKVKILRKGKQKTLTVKLGKLPENEEDLATSKSSSENKMWLGMKTDDISSSIARKFNIDEDESGVVITYVQHGSVAAVNGLLPGDIIKQINNTKIKSIKDYKKFIRKHGNEDTYLLVIKRRGTLFYLTIENEKEK